MLWVGSEECLYTKGIDLSFNHNAALDLLCISFPTTTSPRLPVEHIYGGASDIGYEISVMCEPTALAHQVSWQSPLLSRSHPPLWSSYLRTVQISLKISQTSKWDPITVLIVLSSYGTDVSGKNRKRQVELYHSVSVVRNHKILLGCFYLQLVSSTVELSQNACGGMSTCMTFARKVPGRSVCLFA